MWNVFDLMADFNDCDYADEVIDVFYFLLDRIEPQQINEAYYQFLKEFTQYHMKERSIGNLSEIYFMLLTKGDFLKNSPQGQ